MDTADGRAAGGAHTRVADVMTSPAVTARPDEPLQLVEQRLLTHGITAVPVVDDEDRVVGLLSRTDLVAAPPAVRRAGVAHDVMSWPVATAGPRERLDDAGRRMSGSRWRHLPVVDDGRVVGVLSLADVVRELVGRQDGSVWARARLLVDAFLAYSFGHDVRVDCVCGVVTLEGTVRTSADAEALERLVGRLDGVAAVRNALVPAITWFPESSVYVG